ncbi:MAG: hypothetical protein AB7L41_08305 [Flavobacteriaceae bacterium]
MVLAAAAIAVATLPGQARAAWDCQAYADFALRDVNKAKAAQCGFTGPRWSADRGLHVGFCTERLSANDDNAMTSETRIRENDVFGCEQRFRCTAYSKTAIQAVGEATQLGCGFKPPRWSPDEGLHFGYCMGREAAGDQYAISNETAIRATQLAGCKAARPRPADSTNTGQTGGVGANGTLTVKLDVDLYDLPEGGTQKGVVRRGTVVVLGECRGNNMCSISGGGHVGWIYDGPDWDTLDR